MAEVDLHIEVIPDQPEQGTPDHRHQVPADAELLGLVRLDQLRNRGYPLNNPGLGCVGAASPCPQNPTFFVLKDENRGRPSAQRSQGVGFQARYNGIMEPPQVSPLHQVTSSPERKVLVDSHFLLLDKLIGQEPENTKLVKFANRVFEAANMINWHLDQAQAEPSGRSQHLGRAIAIATKTLDDIAESGDLEWAMWALRLESIPSLQQAMATLGLEKFLKAEERILEQANIPSLARARARTACCELWQAMEDGQSLDASQLMDGVRKLRDKTNHCAESLDLERPEEASGGGIMLFLGRCLEVTLGTMLLTVNMAALGPWAPLATPVAHFLGKELFKEALGHEHREETRVVARIAGCLGEVLIEQAVEALLPLENSAG